MKGRQSISRSRSPVLLVLEKKRVPGSRSNPRLTARAVVRGRQRQYVLPRYPGGTGLHHGGLDDRVHVSAGAAGTIRRRRPVRFRRFQEPRSIWIWTSSCRRRRRRPRRHRLRLRRPRRRPRHHRLRRRSRQRQPRRRSPSSSRLRRRPMRRSRVQDCRTRARADCWISRTAESGWALLVIVLAALGVSATGLAAYRRQR